MIEYEEETDLVDDSLYAIVEWPEDDLEPLQPENFEPWDFEHFEEF